MCRKWTFPAIFLPHLQVLTVTACFFARGTLEPFDWPKGRPYSWTSHFRTAGSIKVRLVWEAYFCRLLNDRSVTNGSMTLRCPAEIQPGGAQLQHVATGVNPLESW